MFKEFQEAVSRQWEKMKSHQLFRTQVEKELMWVAYLEAFPPGTNPLYKERTEHDCQSCKSFIRSVGSVVAYIDGRLVSIWDCEVGGHYGVVASAMSELVKEAPIKNVLLHDQRVAGVALNHQDTGTQVIPWEHFFIELPEACVNIHDRGSVYAEKQSTRDVFARALEEITLDAMETVVELIDQGSLYRGEEHLHTVQTFAKAKREYDELGEGRPREMFTWRQDFGPAVTRVRSSAIGTLLVDISAGKTLDDAVRMFESKVAPQNYKRPKALVTKAMIERARKKVEELGYGASLGRRFARAEDISINEVLFANRDARKAMDADPFDEMISEVKADTKSLDRVEEVAIDDFVERILPKATSIELMLENKHGGNLVNLVAPVDPEAPSILKWGNNFTWSYAGDVADSIRERVKARGGSVTGEFRASLAWFNSDDLDLHLVEPGPRGGKAGGHHIHFGSRRSPTGGELDVDMNVHASGPHTSRNAVENITYRRRSQMPEGVYGLYVNQYTHRESRDVGFEVELEFCGDVTTFAYDQEVRARQNIQVAGFKFTHKDGLEIIQSLPRQDISKVMWGLPSQNFHPVTMVMQSPNHWNGRPVGNRHWFFMLQDCKREGSSRGFFNEQLSDELREHRKVFECLGGKMRTEDEGEQLSGLGFSSTRRSSVFCKVSGAFERTIKITF